ncbi:hypothetical protein GCM10007094_07180 [Pseudovibrio japonicus]|uniref:Lipoprotein n=1 Tax=Pseudovibrio japonicus TaxID=366534 RepID=A0ABQ3DZT6_9HYPH|nr:hypothetical protein GCM10007094_07180 [Pseudovibrio japonicus]
MLKYVLSKGIMFSSLVLLSGCVAGAVAPAYVIAKNGGYANYQQVSAENRHKYRDDDSDTGVNDEPTGAISVINSAGSACLASGGFINCADGTSGSYIAGGGSILGTLSNGDSITAPY